MKIKVWLDSGANIHSKYEDEITLDEMDMTKEEWDALSDEKKWEHVKDIAFSQADMGYEEIE